MKRKIILRLTITVMPGFRPAALANAVEGDLKKGHVRSLKESGKTERATLEVSDGRSSVSQIRLSQGVIRKRDTLYSPPASG